MFRKRNSVDRSTQRDRGTKARRIIFDGCFVFVLTYCFASETFSVLFEAYRNYVSMMTKPALSEVEGWLKKAHDLRLAFVCFVPNFLSLVVYRVEC